jgi:plastocyanin
MRICKVALAFVLPVLIAAAGCGDETKDPTGGAASGSGSTAASSGGASMPIHGCTPEDAEDQTGKADVTVTVADFKYTPACLKVSKGTSVKFSVDFLVHPTIGGDFTDGVATPDPASPIKETKTGTEATFVLADAGTYPYYCNTHASIGMVGVVYVE